MNIKVIFDNDKKEMLFIGKLTWVRCSKGFKTKKEAIESEEDSGSNPL